MKQIVTLDDDELKARADALAATCEAAIALDAERKEVAKDYKQRLDALNKEAARLARIVRTHQEEEEAEQLPFEVSSSAQ